MSSNYLDKININDARLFGATGKGSSISIIDTGFSDYSQFEPVKTLGINASPTDKHGHGTLMSNIVSSIAPEADFYIVNALNDKNKFSQIDLAKAIDWSVQQNVDVISMSIEGHGIVEEELRDSVNNAIASGVEIVASTGNNAPSIVPAWPALINGVHGVGAVDFFDKEALFSKGGKTLDVFAPGVLIEVLNISQDEVYISGTSPAAQIIAGVMLLAIGEGQDPKAIFEKTLPVEGEVVGQVNAGFALHTGDNPLLHHWEQGNELTISYLIPKTEDKFDVSVTVKNNEVYYNLNDRGDFIQYTNGQHVHAFSEVEASEDLIGNLFGAGGIYEAIDTSGIEKGDYQVEVALIGNTSGQPHLFGSELIHLG